MNLIVGEFSLSKRSLMYVLSHWKKKGYRYLLIGKKWYRFFWCGETPQSSRDWHWLIRMLGSGFWHSWLAWKLLNRYMTPELLTVTLWDLWDKTRQDYLFPFLQRLPIVPSSPARLEYLSKLKLKRIDLNGIHLPPKIVVDLFHDPDSQIRTMIRQYLWRLEQENPKEFLKIVIDLQHPEIIPPSRKWLEWTLELIQSYPEHQRNTFLERYYSTLPIPLRILFDLILHQQERIYLHDPPIELLPILEDPNENIRTRAWQLISQRRISDPKLWIWVHLQTGRIQNIPSHPRLIPLVLSFLSSSERSIQNAVRCYIQSLPMDGSIHDLLFTLFLEHPEYEILPLLIQQQRIPASPSFQVLYHFLSNIPLPNVCSIVGFMIHVEEIRMVIRRFQLFSKLSYQPNYEELFWFGWLINELPAEQIATYLLDYSRSYHRNQRLWDLLPWVSVKLVFKILSEWKSINLLFLTQEQRKVFNQVVTNWSRWKQATWERELWCINTVSQELSNPPIPIWGALAEGVPFFLSQQPLYSLLPYRNQLKGLINQLKDYSQPAMRKFMYFLEVIDSLLILIIKSPSPYPSFIKPLTKEQLVANG